MWLLLLFLVLLNGCAYLRGEAGDGKPDFGKDTSKVFDVVGSDTIWVRYQLQVDY